MPHQPIPKTNTSLDGTWARINSPCSAPNHNLSERILEDSLSHHYPKTLSYHSTIPQRVCKSVTPALIEITHYFDIPASKLPQVPMTPCNNHYSPLPQCLKSFPPTLETQRVIFNPDSLKKKIYSSITRVWKRAHIIMAQLNKLSQCDYRVTTIRCKKSSTASPPEACLLHHPPHSPPQR